MGTGAESGTTSLVLAKPPTVSTGNILIAIVGSFIGTGSYGWTPPAGWIKINDFNTASNQGWTAFAKVAASSEPATYTFTSNPGSSINLGGVILCYAAHVVAAGVGAAVNSLTAPSVTLWSGIELVLEVWEQNAGTNTYTLSGAGNVNGATVRFSRLLSGAGGNIAIMVADFLTTVGQATAGGDTATNPDGAVSGTFGLG